MLPTPSLPARLRPPPGLPTPSLSTTLVDHPSYSKGIKRSISELSEDPRETEESVFTPIPETLIRDTPFSCLTVDVSSVTSSPVSFDRMTVEDKTYLSSVHSLVESAYPRILGLDLSPFKHTPFNDGYWPNRYLKESNVMAENWLASTPKLNRSDFWRFTIFQIILKRSTRPQSHLHYGFRTWAMRTVSRLRINHEVWFDLISKCGSLPGNHIMVLKVHKVSHYTFKITLVNVGYGCILDRKDRAYCRDLVTLANSTYSNEFYGFLKKMFGQHSDVPEYYSIMQNTYPHTTRLGSKRPTMHIPLCATETYKRCYKDFLGKRLYASWMSYWTEKELSIIEAKLDTSGLRVLSQLDHSHSPTSVKVSYVPAGATLEDETDDLTAPLYSLDDLNQFLKAATLTHWRYLSFSSSKVDFDTKSPLLKRALGITESGWHYIPPSKALKS